MLTRFLRWWQPTLVPGFLRTRRPVRPTLELLEDRLVLSPTIALDPTNDAFGSQIETVRRAGYRYTHEPQSLTESPS